MAAPRFFCPVPLRAHQSLTLPPDLAHYALRVLRLKDGAQVILFDGSGGQFDAVLRLTGKTAEADVGTHHAIDNELPGRITLVQGLPSGDKMDWIIEKAVELGAHRLVPITAQRSVVQLNPDRRAKRMKHWQRIVQSASEQCGRNRLMHIDEPVSLQAYMDSTPRPDATFLCHPDAETGLAQALDNSSDLSLLVGPEGGWSPEEQDSALKRGAKPVRFGARVLRTETAGLALIAAVSVLKGWT